MLKVDSLFKDDGQHLEIVKDQSSILVYLNIMHKTTNLGNRNCEIIMEEKSHFRISYVLSDA